MAQKLSADEIKEFSAYLEGCTDRQVIGVLEKERAAGRMAYAAMAEGEAATRGLL